jgi:hypothetical protein
VEKQQPLAAKILPDMCKTKPNPDRRGSEVAEASKSSSSVLNGEVTENGSRPGSGTTSMKVKVGETALLKDRDWRGEGQGDGEMWWECRWDGMDGMGGTNKKGKKCFDKVRISWRFISTN